FCASDSSVSFFQPSRQLWGVTHARSDGEPILRYCGQFPDHVIRPANPAASQNCRFKQLSGGKASSIQLLKKSRPPAVGGVVDLARRRSLRQEHLSMRVLFMATLLLSTADAAPRPQEWRAINYAPRGHPYFRMLYDWFSKDAATGLEVR